MKQANRPARSHRPTGRQDVRSSAGARCCARYRCWPRGVGAASCGYALAGPGLVPARLHQDARHPDVRQHHAVSARRAGVHAEGAARVPEQPPLHRGAERRRRRRHRARRDPGDSACSRSASTMQQLASRIRVTVIVKVRFEDVKAQKTLWENPALSFSDEYELASPRQRPGRVGLRRQRARRDGPHVHGLRALRRQRHPRGVLTGREPGSGASCQRS